MRLAKLRGKHRLAKREPIASDETNERNLAEESFALIIS